MSEIRTAHLMTLALEVDEPQVISGTPTGTRRIVYVNGGSFEGARLSGMVLPGGGDWILERADGSFLLDVRITLLTKDREMIYMTYRGIRHANDEVMKRLNNGDVVGLAPRLWRTGSACRSCRARTRHVERLEKHHRPLAR